MTAYDNSPDPLDSVSSCDLRYSQGRVVTLPGEDESRVLVPHSVRVCTVGTLFLHFVRIRSCRPFTPVYDGLTTEIDSHFDIL